MDFIFYCIPNIPVPVTALVFFAAAAVVCFVTKARPVGDIITVALVTVGATVGIIASCDLTLLAALILAVLCAYLTAARLFRVGKGGK